jgi:hypothetical protein
VVEIVLQEDAHHAPVETQDSCKTLQHGVENTIGIKIVANVLYHMNQEEMPMQSTTIQMHHMMLDFGKLTMLIGEDVMEDMPHVIPLKISIVLFMSTMELVILGDHGQPIVPVAVDLSLSMFI